MSAIMDIVEMYESHISRLKQENQELKAELKTLKAKELFYLTAMTDLQEESDKLQAELDKIKGE